MCPQQPVQPASCWDCREAGGPNGNASRASMHTSCLLIPPARAAFSTGPHQSPRFLNHCQPGQSQQHPPPAWGLACHAAHHSIASTQSHSDPACCYACRTLCPACQVPSMCCHTFLRMLLCSQAALHCLQDALPCNQLPGRSIWWHTFLHMSKCRHITLLSCLGCTLFAAQ